MRLRILRVLGIVVLAGLAGCGSLKPKPLTQPFLLSVRQIQPDGSVVTAKEKDLTPFQSYMRERIITGRAIKEKPKKAWEFSSPRVAELVTLEADVPASEDGYEGAYMAVLLFGDGTARLEYYEQAGHGPRYDRYFHRELTAAERNALLGFLKTHPVETLLPKAVASEVTGGAGGAAEASGLMFRITDATAKSATSVLLPDSGSTQPTPPVMELVKLFGAMRDRESPPLVCTYLRAIPMEATVLFASPTRQVAEVWANDGQVRIEVENGNAEAKWYLLQGGEWVTSEAPPVTIPATQPVATRPAAPTQAVVPVEHRPVVAAPKAEPVFPRLPKPPTTAELLARMEVRPAPMPSQEAWFAQPREGHTVFTHYVPRAAGPGGVMPQGESVQVIIPGLEFDSAHMAMTKGMLYVVHEGQLVAMPVPAAAAGR